METSNSSMSKMHTPHKEVATVSAVFTGSTRNLHCGIIAPLLALTFIAGSGTSSAVAETIFNDNFTETTLNSAWITLPGQGGYSVGDGELRYFNDGPQASTTGWISPALTLAFPFAGTNWEIQTEATYNLQYLNSFGGSSGAQGPEVVVKFAPGVTTGGSGGPNYAGTNYAVIERDVDACSGCAPSNYLAASYGAVSNSNLINPTDAGTPPPNDIGSGTYWYRIIRDGGTLTIEYSYDGDDYQTAFSTAIVDPTNYNELLLGGITWQGVGSYTDYSYVDITGNSAPEPATWAMALTGLPLILAGGLFRRRYRKSR